MAYDFFPKKISEISTQLEKKNWPIENISEVILLFSHLKKKFSAVETPINIDFTKQSVINISRSLSEDVNVSSLKSNLSLKKIKFKFGNGSSGNRGKNNRGNLFEPQFAEAFLNWWSGNPVNNNAMEKCIKDIYETYNLHESQDIYVDVVGGENTRRPLKFSGSGIILDNPKGTGFYVGPSVTDITLTTDKRKEIFLSLKLGTTTTFFNVGVKTILTTNEIKSGNITNTNGLILLKTFGIDPVRFTNVFNGVAIPTNKRIDRNAKYDNAKIQKLLESGIGYGYHIVHKIGSNIISKNMDKSAMKKAAKISGPFVVYYGGKTGTGKRIDVEFSSGSYDFKINIRDTQGSTGYPTRMMCDFKYK